MIHKSFEELLQVENSSDVFEFRCPSTNYLLWPLVRTQFFRQLISDMLYKNASLLAPVTSVPYGNAIKVLPKVLLHNFRQHPSQSEILVFGTGAGQFQRAGQGFNRINDYFVEATSRRASTVEGMMDWHLPEPRWNKNVTYWLPWQATMLLVGRICARDIHIKKARDVLEYARSRAYALHGISISEQNFKVLVGVVSRKIARLPFMERAYIKMFEKFKPRLLLLEEGCYSDHGILNHVAREMGVRVAEPQHGMVSAGHDAYNYAPLLRESEDYRNYLPHDFLGYGQWWNDQINVPVRKWVVGNPHYSEQLPSMLSMGMERKDILILGDGFEFPLYLALADELALLLKGRYRVVLRPHPLEREKVCAEFPDGVAGKVSIDHNRNIYESFSSAYVVAGEVSTGLFEALGVVPKVLLWETSKARFSCPSHPFVGFSDAQEFARAILTPEMGQSAVEQGTVWASHWRDNYQRFLQHALR